MRIGITRRKDQLAKIDTNLWESIEQFDSNFQRLGVVAFVASLSTEGDLLSQWRGYNRGKGYSIGFDANWIAANAVIQNFAFLKIEYDVDIQNDMAENIVDALLKLLKGPKSRSHDNYGTFLQWWEGALRVALSMKNPHFKEECEYRLVYFAKSWPYKTQVRPSSGGIVPYLQFRLNDKKINNPLNHTNNEAFIRIVIGPALKSQQIAAIDALLAPKKMRFQVVKSDIPFAAD